MTDMSSESVLEAIVRDWFLDPHIALACGDWTTGAIMELLPDDKPVLTAARYPAPFTGLRDVRLVGQAHHLHLDLNKIAHVVYAIVPSVCYGYRPSFEAHFVPRLDAPPSFAVMVRKPYCGERTNRPALIPYFQRMLDHLARYPSVVRLRIEAPPKAPSRATWDDVRACLLRASAGMDPPPSLLRAMDDFAVEEAACA